MKLLAIDIESASHYVRGSICSFGYVLFEYISEPVNSDTDDASRLSQACAAKATFTETARGDIIINPVCRIVDKHCKLVYDRAEYKKHPSFAKTAPQINALITGADVIVGHAINNDLRFIAEAYMRYKLKIPAFKYICTQNLYRTYHREINSIGVEAATALLNLDGLTAHKAEDDAFVSMKLLEKLLNDSGLTLDGLLDSLKMIYGEYSDAVHIRHFDGKHNKDLLFEDCIKKLPPLSAFSKRERRQMKKYYFDQSLITNDIDYARNLVYSVQSSGACYIHDKGFGSVNYYVIPDGHEISAAMQRRISNSNHNGGRIEIITDKQLLTKIPYLTLDYPDDAKIIRSRAAVRQGNLL